MKGDCMEYYFDGDDRLDRKRYAEFLKTMLEHCDDYRREDSDGAYVIAIDSPWGTGKTRFAKMLRNYLEGREPRIIEDRVDRSFIPQASEHREFNVIYYNSWDTDYWNDALEPLIYSIMNSQVLEVEGAEEDIEKLKIAIGSILKGMAMALVKLAFGDAASSLVGGAIDGFDSIPDDPLVEYKQRLDQYTDFKATLNSAIERTGKKLVIIVDELDRCRPTFAIQTLELAKHLFDVEGLIFIFALDIEQLSHAVKTVYGTEMDASGYLCRFFDYIGKLLIPERNKFIGEILTNGNYDLTRFSEHYPELTFKTQLTAFLANLSGYFNLSFRDLYTILIAYKMLLNSFLKKYFNIDAHKLYLVLITLKYKKTEIFAGLIQGHLNKDFLKQTFQTLMPEHAEASFLLGCEKIENAWCYLYHLERQETKVKIKIGSVNINEYVSNGRIVLHYSFYSGSNTLTSRTHIDVISSFGKFLFFEDLYKWEEIKGLTLAQYYHRQLEMFDFVLPAEQEHGEN